MAVDLSFHLTTVKYTLLAFISVVSYDLTTGRLLASIC